MYGHERSLVKNHSGKPFALIGVNTDDSLEIFRSAVEDNELNWRSFYDGRSGRIVGQYNIEGFPTVFLIDHKGVIRYRMCPVDPNELDRAIAELLAEVSPSP
jgi:hypothetical protein